MASAKGFPIFEGGDGKVSGATNVLQQVLAKISELYDGFTIDIRQFHDGGDTVIMEGYYTRRWIQQR